MNNTNKSLLLADSDPAFAMKTAKSLEKEGYTVIRASSGRKAVEAVQARPDGIDLIIMDTDLGRGMDGVEAARKILQKHDIPVIFFSANTGKDIEAITEKVTAYGFTAKKSGNAALLVSIRMALKLHNEQKSLHESEERYRKLVEISPDAIVVHRDGYFMYSNPAGVKMMKAARADELVGRPILDYVHPDYHDLVISRTRQSLKSGKEMPLVEQKLIRPDGSVFDVEVTSTVFTLDGRLTVQSIIRDITERKRLEETLRLSEEKFYKSFQTLPIALCIARLSDRTILDVNDAFTVITGYAREELIGSKSTDLNLWVDTKDLDLVIQTLRTDGKITGKEFKFRGKSGETGFGYYFAYIISIGGEACIFVAIQDIRERKRAEEALRESEDRYRTLVETSPDPIIMYSLTGEILSANREAALQYGFSSVDEFLSQAKNVLGLLTEEGRAFAVANFSRTLATGSSSKNEYLIPLRDGSKGIAEINSAVIRSSSGDPKAFISVLRDITERKRAEKALMESEKRLAAFMNSATDLFLLLDSDLNLITGNVKSTGYLPQEIVFEDVLGKNIADIFPSARESGRFDEYKKVLETGEPYISDDISIPHKPGTININISAFKAGECLGMIIRDITDRKRFEEALRDSEATLRALINAPTDSIILMDARGVILELNEIAARRFGKSRDELIGNLADNSIPVDIARKRRSLLSDVFQAGKTVRFEDERNGVWFDTIGYPVLNNDGTVIKMAIFARDITERKRIEDALKNSLKEKELLMRELQHRVKNNLSIISSLFDLEMNKPVDDTSMQVLAKAKSRIEAMSRIYGRLYQSEDLNSVSLDEYIHEFTDWISGIFTGESRSVRFSTSLAKINVDLRIAVPLGLILNEIVTNSLKYSHPQGEKGEIRIELSESGGEAELCVSDNGPGLPDGFDPAKADTLGMRLITALTEQIQGSVAFENKNGTTVRVKFRT